MRKQRKHCATGGNLDPYSMLAAQGTQLAGDYMSALNYKPQLGAEKSQKDYAQEIIMKGIQGGGIYAIPSIIRMYKDKNTIVSGSPGQYQQGGPIQTSTRTNVNRRPIYVDGISHANQNIMNIPSPQPLPNPLDQLGIFNTPRPQSQVPYPIMINEVGSSKSKAKDRFREKATGGRLDEDANPNDADDKQLSNNSFQVKGNPNETDGNSYPELNANLDHNEVVDSKAKFVFSDDLKMPGSKRSFAQEAKPLYSKVGKLETRFDPISNATKEQLNKQINNLAMTQEQLATSLGLRNNQSQNAANGGVLINYRMRQSPPLVEAPQYYATGGPLPWEGFGVKEFQQWANQQGYIDPTTKKPITVDNSWGPTTQAAFSQLGNTFASQLGLTNQGGTYKRNSPLLINNNAQGLSVPTGENQYQSLDANRPNWMAPAAPQNKPIYIDTPEGPVDISELEGRQPVAEAIKDRARRIGITTTLEPQTGSLDTPSQTASLGKDYTQGFTPGDILQGIEVGSKFFNIAQGAEKERQLVNTTPISRTGYDVQSPLYQNQRNYQNSVNGIGSASAPQRRALANQLLATKLNADNQVMSQYQNMNNEATVNYENRVSNQRQQNIASAFRTNDLNAANRGAYDQAQQNAFTSLGNYGEAINNRKMSLAALQLLKSRYPDVYASVMGGLNKS